MSKEAESKVTVLKERLADGEYRVDTKEVADAFLHRPSGVVFALAPQLGATVGPRAA